MALSDEAGEPMWLYHGQHGEFNGQASDRSPPDFRARGRHRRFEGDGTWLLKTEADAPTTLPICADFDGPVAGTPGTVPLKTYVSLKRDWRDEDPTGLNGRGKSIIGALNYLPAAGVNGISSLTYNAGDDGDNVWPSVACEDKFHYDGSKLDQWNRVFDHATHRGLQLRFKLRETEMDDHRREHGVKPACVSDSLDGGRPGPERRLYLCELIAHFDHPLALTWNLGEECTLTTDEIMDMANAGELVGNPRRDKTVFGLARPGNVTAVCLLDGGLVAPNRSGTAGRFSVEWFNPRRGGALRTARTPMADGGRPVAPGPPPKDPGEDWAIPWCLQ